MPKPREILEILGFGAPGKANLPCPVLFEIDSYSLLDFFRFSGVLQQSVLEATQELNKHYF